MPKSAPNAGVAVAGPQPGRLSKICSSQPPSLHLHFSFIHFPFSAENLVSRPKADPAGRIGLSSRH
jgi:hypothetical protein